MRGQLVDREFRVLDVLAQPRHHVLHELLVAVRDDDILDRQFDHLVAGRLRGELLEELAPLGQQVVDAGQQQFDAERLGDVAVGAELHGLHPVVGRVAGREHHDRDVAHREVVAHLVDQFDAVHAGPHQVGDDDVGHLAADLFEGLDTVVGLDDVIGVYQTVVHEDAQFAVILDQEDFLRVLRRRDVHAALAVGGREVADHIVVAAFALPRPGAREVDLLHAEVGVAEFEFHGEGGAFARTAVDRDFAVVQGHDVAAERKADTRPLHVAVHGARSLRETLENHPLLVLRDADARVADGERHALLLFAQ